MEFSKQEVGLQQGVQDSECPVCYECLSGTERTLSCGHIFCHDCLVQTLVCVNRGEIIRDSIICPICRHLTFIRKQKEAVISHVKEKHIDEQQTLKILLPLPQNDCRHLGSTQHATRNHIPRGLNWIAQLFRGISERFRRHRLVNPSQNVSQIFIISDQGRPMAEEDALSVVMTVVQPRLRRRRRICTTGRCLLFLLLTFTILALLAATIPWILLA